MKKSCPACGQPLSDETKQFCSRCEALELCAKKLSQADLEQLSHIVSKKMKADWKFKAQIAGAVILGVLAVIGVIDVMLGFNLRENMAKRFENQESQAKLRIDDHLAKLDYDVKSALAQVDLQMRSNIVRNFEAPVIQAIIQDVAKAESKGILENEVRPAVDSFRADALFARIVARAQAYDFKAYLRLLEIAKQTNENAQLANQVVADIGRSLEKDRYGAAPTRLFMMASGTNFYRGPFTSDEVAMRFSLVTRDRWSSNREGFVNTVREFKQPLFLTSLIEMLTNETDLVVADRLTSAISDIAKEDFHPHDFERLMTWWKDRQAFYTTWPLATLERGFWEFSTLRYAQAAEAFEQVLKLDSGADMSRAYAIFCYWETGESNRAVTLAKEFKNTSARWAQWAAAKAELEAGSISNATVLFASIMTNVAKMDRLPARGSHVLRNIDWNLFDRLTGTNAP
jgi:hypothetical protein